MSSISYVTGNKTKVYKCDKNIRFIYREENLPLSDNELLQINQLWNEMVKENTSLYNGKVLTANKIMSEKDDINIHLLCTDYSHLTYTMNFANENVTTCKSIASGGLIITNDNYLVFGKMGKMTSFPGVIQCIGGGLDLEDLNKGGEATVNTVIRECEEEIGIRIAKENIIGNKKYIYLREKMSTIGFCYIVYLEMNHTELVNIFESHKVSHEEIEDLILVRYSKDDIINFCQNSMLVDYIKDVILDFSGIDTLGQV